MAIAPDTGPRLSMTVSADRWKVLACRSYWGVFRALRNCAVLEISTSFSALACTLARSLRVSPSRSVCDSFNLAAMSGSGSRFFFRSWDDDGTTNSGTSRAAYRNRGMR